MLLMVALSSTAVFAVPAGTRLSARMNRSIGSAQALGPDRVADVTHAGEEYTASLIAPVVDDEGRARVAAGTILQGHVAVLAAGTGADLAKLELSADALDGRALRAHVVTTEVQWVQSSDLGLIADRSAFVGMLLGGIAFGLPGVMIGYGAGAGGAAVGTLQERRVEAWLAAGSTIVVELDEPLAVTSSP
jgi:hypothetical protein